MWGERMIRKRDKYTGEGNVGSEAKRTFVVAGKETAEEKIREKEEEHDDEE